MALVIFLVSWILLILFWISRSPAILLHHLTLVFLYCINDLIDQMCIRDRSLCMRLFGNVLGAFVIMKLIEYVLPVGLPVIFSAYFDLFDGLIQAYVFVFLTGLFIKESME